METNKKSPSSQAKTWRVIRALFDRRTPVMPKIIGIVLLAYIIIPFDLLPDAPFIGWLDDASLAALGLFIISKIVPESVLDEYRGVSGVRGPESGVKDENQDNH